MMLMIARSMAFGFLFLAGTLSAQEAPSFPQPTTEHQWLEKFSGSWTTSCSAKMGPDQPAQECKGTLTSKMVGGFWLINETKGEWSGMPMIGVQTIGYDEGKEKYVGTWIDSATSFMWKYEGSVDKGKTTLTLEADGPNFFVPGKMAKFQDIYEFKSDNEIAMTSQIQSDDGKWIIFMSGTATRSN